ncbi:MAG: HAMP domain-containing protein [Desulfobacteraceae bacterium]|nr:HAMP domain-containing protein [Desulfobacteraceae bacterium]
MNGKKSSFDFVKFSNIKIRYKLFSFVVMAMMLALTMVGVGKHYYTNIENAYLQKEQFNQIVKKNQDARIAEKSYHQFYKQQFKEEFLSLNQSIQLKIKQILEEQSNQKLQNKTKNSADEVENYRKTFSNIVKVYDEHYQLKNRMAEPLNESLKVLHSMQLVQEEKQFEKQMMGEVLEGDEMELMNVIRDVKINLLTLQTIQQNYLATRDVAYLDNFKKVLEGDFSDDNNALKNFAIGLNNKTFIATSEKIKNTVDLFLELVTRSQELGAMEDNLVLRLDEIGNELFAIIDDILNDTNKIIASERNSAVTAIITIIGAGLLGFLLVSVVLVRMIIKPLDQVVHGLKDIAEGEGDLATRLNVKTHDEMGELAKWFNVFIGNIQLIIKELAGNAELLNNSSKNLMAISDHVSVGSEQASSKAHTVAAAGEQMSSNMISVSAAMEQASTNIDQVAAAAEEMTVTITEIAQSTEKARNVTSDAVEQASSASNRVQELGNSAQDIGKVVETITEISEQVNLLALNATIEAARAGDAGKGFAVVANEIKELAKQTAEATGEIKQKVQGIQRSTGNTVTEIKTITKVVNDVNDIVSTIASAVGEQSSTTREIASNVAQASQGISEVNFNVAQCSTVAQEIAGDIAAVTQASNEISTSSSQVNISSSELSELANKLDTMVGRFKT